MRSISQCHRHVNDKSQFSNNVVSTRTKHNILNQTTIQTHNMLYGPYGDASVKHRIMKDAIKDCDLPRSIINFLEDLVNHSNADGETIIGHKKLAKLLTCSERTIRNYFEYTDSVGLTKREKRGWMRSNTTTLIPINKVAQHLKTHKAANISPYLSDHKFKHRELNKHYDEYECLLDNKQDNQEVEDIKPLQTIKHPSNNDSQLEDADKPKQILMSERSALTQTLEHELLEAIQTHIPHEYLDQSVLVLKRLKAKTKEKLDLILEIGQCAKQFVIKNISGLFVARFKKLTEKKNMSTNNQPIDYDSRKALRARAEELAKKNLNQRGIVDPFTTENPDLDEAREYEAILTTEIALCLNKICGSERKPKAKAQGRQPQDWAVKAYG